MPLFADWALSISSHSCQGWPKLWGSSSLPSASLFFASITQVFEAKMLGWKVLVQKGCYGRSNSSFYPSWEHKMRGKESRGMRDAFQPFCPPSVHAFIPLQPHPAFLYLPPSCIPKFQAGSKLGYHPRGSQSLSIHPRMERSSWSSSPADPHHHALRVLQKRSALPSGWTPALQESGKPGAA